MGTVVNNPGRPWREIAEAVLRESDSEKVVALTEELIQALNKQTSMADAEQTPMRDEEKVRRKSA